MERYSAHLVGVLADLAGDDRVHVLALWQPPGARVPRGRLVRPGEPRGHLRPAARSAYLAAGARAVARHRPRFVVAAHPHLAHAGALLSALGRCPLVVVAHGREAWDRCSPLVRWGLRRAAAVWPVSRFTGEQVARRQGVDPSRVRVVAPGLPVPAPGGHESRRGEVLTVARLAPESRYKGVDTLLRCWPAVRREVPGARLVVVGDGADRARLETSAPPAGVRFAGEVSDVALSEHYRAAAVFALPSRARTGPRAEGDGLGLVCLEAALAGLPVVAGEGGPAEAVVHGRTGLVVDPRCEQAVAAALVELLADPPRAARLGEAGRRRAVEQFSTAAFGERVRAGLEALSSA